MILENLEFDGSTVLCRVCGDKASGFHYGVHACEGCKGFFRRSIQQKIQYRPCLKNQECSIVRVNRNRCQYCRLKKCISVGMSRDAVRFGRVPKKEKAKIMEQMKRVNAHSELNTLQSFLENDPEFTTKIITAHFKHCDFTKQKMKGLGDAAWRIPHFINCPAQMACPLNPKADTSQSEDSGQWGDVSELFTPAIKNVVNFAKSIPGFQVFSQEDQVTLLKAGTFEVLLLHLAPLFDAKHNTMMFANGKLFKRSAYPVMSNAGFLLDSMFDFSERMQSLDLCEEEIALFSAAVIIASDRPGLRNVDIVGKVQTKVHEGLQNVLRQNHPDDKSLFPKILMKMPDLRTLSILHSEKLSGMTVTSTSGDHMGDQKDLGRTTIRCPQNSGVSATLDPCSCYVSSSDDVQTGCWRNPTKPFIPSFNRSQDSNQGIIHPAHINYQRSHVPCTSSYSINYDNVTSNKSRNKMHIPQIENSFQQEFISDRSRITFQHNIKMEANNDFVQNLKNEGMEKINFSHPVKYLQNVVESKVGHIFQSDNSLEPMDKGICPEGDFDEERKIYRRKRAFNMSTSNTQEKIKPKMPRLQELCASETRSSRSNSVSSCSSIDSIDSAYRTMSSPSTPRSIGSIDICPPYVNKCIRDAKYNKYVSTDKETNIEPSISHIVSSSSSSSNTNASSDLIKSNRVVGTTSNWSFKKVIHVPLLKHALSVPPLCDQETWFYNPNKDTFDESHYMKQAQNQVSEIPTCLSEHDDSIVKDSNKSAEVSDADEKLPDPHVKSVEDWKLEQLHSNSLTRTQESPLSNMDLPPMYRPYYGIYPAFFYQYAALHQHIQARSHFDKFMQHLRTDPPGTEVDNLALKEESQ